MPPIQKAVAHVGIGKQSAKGTPQATNLHAHGVSGGVFAAIDLKQDLEELTSAWAVSPGVVREEAISGFNYTTRAYSKGLHAILAAILGQDTISGAGPYVHTCVVPANQSQPYVTLHGSLGTTPLISEISDALLDEVTIKWEKGGPVTVEVTGIGCVLTLGGAFGTITNDDKNDASNIFGAYTGGAALFKYDVDSATPLAGTVAGGEIKIKRNVEAVPGSGLITPADVFPGQIEIEWTLKTIPANVDDWRTIMTGTAGGTALSGVPVYGSADVTFTSVSTPAHTAQFQSTRIAWMADYPEADPKGGPATVELKGQAVLPTAGTTPLTAIVTNAITPGF